MPFLTAEQFQAHWQGHRRLTRRFIAAFPEKEFFEYSIGGMRPFADLVAEVMMMALPTLEGIATDTWSYIPPEKFTSREQVLAKWDEITASIDSIFPTVPEARWQANMKAFGQWDGTGYWLMLYIIDNEIHHRAQGSVYLRSLGIEPPSFPDRT